MNNKKLEKNKNYEDERNLKAIIEKLKNTNGYKLDKAMREFFAADDEDFMGGRSNG